MSTADNSASKAPGTVRWIDLSGHGMAMKAIGYEDGQAMILEGGDNDTSIAEKLGFSKVGEDWLAPTKSLQLGIVRLVAPEAKLSYYHQDDLLVTRDGPRPLIPTIPPSAAAVAFNKMPKQMRWVDLSHYGLELKRVIDDRGFLFNEIRGDMSPVIASAIGFDQAPDGSWVGRDMEIDTMSIRRWFPECKIETMGRGDIAEDRRDATARPARSSGGPSPR